MKRSPREEAEHQRDRRRFIGMIHDSSLGDVCRCGHWEDAHHMGRYLTNCGYPGCDCGRYKRRTYREAMGR